MSDKELIYIADPMCSWCWGFSPVMDQVSELIRDKAALKVLPGGLRMDARMPLSQYEADEILHHWKEVATRTGQPFDFDRPPSTEFVYNTEPGCRALSVMIRFKPACGLEYLKTLQQAWYVGRRDLKDTEVLADYAPKFGLSREQFIEKFDALGAREALNEDVGFVRQCGIEGYPSVLIRTDQRIQRLTIGYQPFEALQPHLKQWLDAA